MKSKEAEYYATIVKEAIKEVKKRKEKEVNYYLISFDYIGDKRMFIDKLVKAQNIDEAIDKIKSKYPLATEFTNDTITEW